MSCISASTSDNGSAAGETFVAAFCYAPPPVPMVEAPLIDCRRITKRFAGVTVVAEADFQVRGGEVHALLGENGAGKSTLLKVMAGVHRPDEGEIRLDGRLVIIPTPHAATKLGIALIHQEPQGFPDLSVAENVFLGHDLPRRWGQAPTPASRADAAGLRPAGPVGFT